VTLNVLRFVPLLLAALVAAGCASFREQPVGSASAPVVVRHVGPSKPAAKPSRKRGDERPESYVVQRGDTLFGIALDFGFDYRELAAWNDLPDPGRIFAGQRLRLTPPAKEASVEKDIAVPQDAASAKDPVPDVKPLAAPSPVAGDALPKPGDTPTDVAPNKPVTATSAVPVFTEPRALTQPYSDQALARMTRPGAPVVASIRVPAAPDPKANAADAKPPAADARPAPAESKPAAAKPTERPDADKDSPAAEDDSIDWSWPVRGDLLYRFGESGRLKGVGIAGRSGQPIAAAAAGRVVYSGSGLRGYGRLVIVKHNETYLSVYAHNSALAVKEGDVVKRGQKIAEMGDSDATRVGLHFEIRRFGKPLDPLGRLPGG
jgi:lipoprotein NlpD